MLLWCKKTTTLLIVNITIILYYHLLIHYSPTNDEPFFQHRPVFVFRPINITHHIDCAFQAGDNTPPADQGRRSAEHRGTSLIQATTMSTRQIRLVDDPCFLEAMVIGVLSGLAFAWHKRINLNAVKKFNRSAIKPLKMPPKRPNQDFGAGFILAGGISFATCRTVRRTKAQKLKDTFDKIRQYNSSG